MSTELDRLRAALPELDDAAPPAATRARIDALIATEGVPGTRAERGAWTRRAPRLALLAGALALVVAGVLAAWPGSDSRPRLLAPPSADARVACAPRGARHVAGCARALSALSLRQDVPGHGDVLYRRGSYAAIGWTVDDHADAHDGNHIRLASARRPFRVLREASEQYWLAPDGRGRTEDGDPGPARLASSADVAAWRADGAPDLERLTGGAQPNPFHPRTSDVANLDDVLLGSGGLYDFLRHDGDPLASVPRDAAALEPWLRRRAVEEGRTGPLVETQMVQDISTLLAYPGTPPDLVAALVAVLGRRPGARSLGLLDDGHGGTVAAIGGLAPGTTDLPEEGVVGLDPQTGQLRALGGRDRDGVVRWDRTVATTSVRVAAIGDVP